MRQYLTAQAQHLTGVNSHHRSRHKFLATILRGLSGWKWHLRPRRLEDLLSLSLSLSRIITINLIKRNLQIWTSRKVITETSYVTEVNVPSKVSRPLTQRNRVLVNSQQCHGYSGIPPFNLGSRFSSVSRSAPPPRKERLSLLKTQEHWKNLLIFIVYRICSITW